MELHDVINSLVSAAAGAVLCLIGLGIWLLKPPSPSEEDRDQDEGPEL